MNHKAIFNLYPNVVSVDDSVGAKDANGNSVVVDKSLVDAEALRLKEAYEAEQIQAEADKASAVSKLEALGLTDAEIKALSGGL
jgi:hypothetical protein